MQTTPHVSETAAEMDQAHELLEAGKREAAYRLVLSILKEHPRCSAALALRDRLNAEDCTHALAQVRNDSFEEEDYSPLLPLGMLILSLASAVFGVFLLIHPVRMAGEMGMNGKVEMGGRMIHSTQEPVHLLFAVPAAFFLIALLSFYGYRRFKL